MHEALTNGVRIELIRGVACMVVYINGEALPITTREPTYRQMTYRRALNLLRSVA